jgi:hypothetical protein
VQLKVKSMKRLVCAALALSLIGSTAAVAQPYGRSGGWGGYSHQDHGRGDNGAGLAVGLGVGLFALAAIAASQHHDRGYDGYDNHGYGYGGGSHYNQGGYTPRYGGGYSSSYGYDGGYGGYGHRHDYNNYSRQNYGNYNYGGYGYGR